MSNHYNNITDAQHNLIRLIDTSTALFIIYFDIFEIRLRMCSHCLTNETSYCSVLYHLIIIEPAHEIMVLIT